MRLTGEKVGRVRFKRRQSRPVQQDKEMHALSLTLSLRRWIACQSMAREARGRGVQVCGRGVREGDAPSPVIHLRLLAAAAARADKASRGAPLAGSRYRARLCRWWWRQLEALRPAPSLGAALVACMPRRSSAGKRQRRGRRLHSKPCTGTRRTRASCGIARRRLATAGGSRGVDSRRTW